MIRFTIETRRDNFSYELENTVKDELSKRGCIYDPQNPELVICIGGDGTLLHAFHRYLDKIDSISFVGIHTGTLGFSTDYILENIEEFFDDVTHKEPTYDDKRILEVTCFGKDGSKHSFFALNEIRVENIVKTQNIEVSLNGEYFEFFRGNGLCVSGQHGSTAYNRSIGGAVIYCNLDLLQVTEISGIHHRHARSLAAPLILDPDTIIQFSSDSFEHALLCYDHLHIHLDNIEHLEIKHNIKKMRFAHYKSISYIERLNALF
ncbi:NAD+ kinase [Erysipelothrix larvae]|uniref:NAD+ kinase n=1 Tax=Erysipelothrix larvae TaxID=1514105 RepID=A0A109UGD4_9FIRM|nr:NAD kinase [Erysipelothrix larvae]AMC92446.1 NAD+ kinase [Erysipelothrix larvae]